MRGSYYHVYNRGARRGRIFFSPENYEYCIRLLGRYRARYSIVVIAYCLMPNHYHLLVRQSSDIRVSKLINVTFNAYVQAVNKQQERSGTLFEGRFRFAHVDSLEYVDHLCRYIHLNPVKNGLVSLPDDWPYSSYQDWLARPSDTMIDLAFVKERFPDVQELRAFMADEAHYARMGGLSAARAVVQVSASLVTGGPLERICANPPAGLGACGREGELAWRGGRGKYPACKAR